MNFSTSNQIKIKQKFFPKAILQTAFRAEFPVAFWQMPQSKIQESIIDLNSDLIQKKIIIEENSKGFVVSPFINPANENTFFIQADLHFQIKNNETELLENSQNFSEEKKIREKKFYQYLTKFLESSESSIIPKDLTKNEYFSSKEENYKSNVKKGIEAIKNNQFQKIVFSRIKSIKLAPDFDIWDTFQKLTKKYPNAFVYLFYLPKKGLWLGATPETLIETEYNIFRTMSLAGTQVNRAEQSLAQTLWTQKEIEEQAMVSRYIINCFKKIRLREFEEIGPKTVIAGNLRHLRTMFEVDMQEVNFMQLASVMLDLLHPTSAVCGLPKKPALEFLTKTEKHDRRFYSGFLGPINFKNRSHIFVNLRCMEITPAQALLYAGAGITEDSEPEKEWLETEMKCQTMLNVLRKD